jgi:hypothetical protein|tara:strand:- start:497 stop:643 length:147 start_codon:yes stop_codon:yes gene_type:complete
MDVAAGKFQTSIKEAVNAVLNKEHMILFLYKRAGNPECSNTVESMQDH